MPRPSSLFRRCGNALVAAAVGFAAATCGEGTEPNTLSVDEFFSSVSTTTGVQAALRTGSPPGEGSGPTVTPSSTGAAIVGGSSQIGLSASAGFRTIIVFVDGVEDYYEITLPAEVTEATIVVTLTQNPPQQTFDCVYAVSQGGTFGTYAAETITAVGVGTGEIQVSVSWDAPSDVDLHVVDPSGEEIYFGNRQSESGGELDLDSNPACSLDNVNNENITWPEDGAPRGEYVVRVNYWADCGVAETNYVVTIQVQGRAPQTFRGTFTGSGTGGGLGDGEEITRFTF